ncbi:hypothetical protein [Burkholderia ubonensis]|uniref:hypothetical protein n=1 Tax=Burkholderia ubonensis TaxID=101571 RepID=UPI0007562C41|nr:hypothetical protein [Burkholderia ubonensis]
MSEQLTWGVFEAVTALAKVARSTGLSEAERADARHEILLVLGAIDGYFDSKGVERTTLGYALRNGLSTGRAPSV